MDERDARSRDILACLGDSSRFRIVLSLIDRQRCVTELADQVGLSQSCTTRHLQYLEREGIVRGARQGKRVVFRLRSDRPRVRELLAWVTAVPPDALRERVSGADVHAEIPVRAGRPRVDPSSGGFRRDELPATPGRMATTVPDSKPSEPAGSDGIASETTSSPPDDREGESATKSPQMEDWLL